MMRLLTTFVVVWSVLGTLSAPPAQAGIGAGDFEIGIETGFVHYDDEVSDDTAKQFALRIGYHITDLFQLELYGARSDTQEPEPTDASADTTLTTYFLDGVFNFHVREDVVPYALVGVGSADLDFETNLFEDQDDDLAARAAGGIRFLLGRNHRTAARIEAGVTYEDAFREDSYHPTLGFGFSWRLGR